MNIVDNNYIEGNLETVFASFISEHKQLIESLI